MKTFVMVLCLSIIALCTTMLVGALIHNLRAITRKPKRKP